MRELTTNEINGDFVSGGNRLVQAIVQVATSLYKASQTEGAVRRADEFERATGDNIYGGNGPKY